MFLWHDVCKICCIFAKDNIIIGIVINYKVTIDDNTILT